MHFENPLFLKLLPLSLVPYVLHMLSYRVRRKQPFPYVKLLRTVKEKQTGFRRFADLFLATIRALLVLFLLLFLSKPYVHEGKMYKFIVVDVSASMYPFRKDIHSLVENLEHEDVIFLPPQRYLGTFSMDMLETLDTPFLVISDFQRSNFHKLPRYAYKLGEVERNYFIEDVMLEDGKLVVRTNTKGHLEVYREDELVWSGAVDTLDTLDVQVFGKLKLKLSREDEIPVDNTFYIYKPNAGNYRVEILAEGVDYKLLKGYFGSFAQIAEYGDVVVLSRKYKDTYGKRSIVFFHSGGRKHTTRTNYMFKGTLLDTVILFGNSPILVEDNVLFIGIKVKEALLEPKLLSYIDAVVRKFLEVETSEGRYVGDTLKLPYSMEVELPNGILLKTDFIRFRDTGFYYVKDMNRFIYVNVDRKESLNDYHEVENSELPRKLYLHAWLLLPILVLLASELLMVSKRA